LALTCTSWPPADATMADGVQQLFVRNLAGRSIGVFVDLSADAYELGTAFAEREGLPAPLTGLRFVFNGRQLEPGLPLWKYGVAKGSTIHAHVRPNAAIHPIADSASANLAGCAEEVMVRDIARRRGSLIGLAKQKINWMKLKVTIVTPFAEVDGTLEFPQERWSSCRLSPSVLRQFLRVSDVLGVCTQGEESSWRLRLGHLCQFPCVQPSTVTDIWHRLQTTNARIEVQAPKGVPMTRANMLRPMVNEDDEVHLGQLDQDFVKGLHLSITLLMDAERAVDDLTVLFRETEETAYRAEICCICLEPMATGDMCRRLACLHSLHAGCAMKFLPEMPSCPVCRSSLASPPSLQLPSPRGSPRRRQVQTTPRRPTTNAPPTNTPAAVPSSRSDTVAPPLPQLPTPPPTARASTGRPSRGNFSVPHLVKRALNRVMH